MAFNSANNLESSILEEDGFGNSGYLILAVLYLSMGVGSLLAAPVIKAIGTKWCLIFGGIGSVIPILATILPELKIDYPDIFIEHNGILTILIISKIINGVTVSILFTAAN